MRARGQFLVAVVVVGVVAAGGYARTEVGVADRAPASAGAAFSGAWFCPHGGDRGWTVTLTVANPGKEPVSVRVRSIGTKRPTAPQDHTVEPGTHARIRVPAPERGRGSIVEYFGGWVAAGWVTEARGEFTGVAAEACLPSAASSWLVPDASTEQGHDDAIVLMNPFRGDAVVTVTLLFDGRPPLTPKSWSDLVVRGRHGVALRLNRRALGERTVGTIVRASLGRVAVASLGVTRTGGLRSAVGVPDGPDIERILPGGADGGQSDVVAMGPLETPTGLIGRVLADGGSRPAAGLEEVSVRPRSARTFPVITEGPSTIVLTAGDAGAFAVARRSVGTGADQGATVGAAAGRPDWVVPPAVASHQTPPRLFLANPGDEPATVTLTLLPTPGSAEAPAPVTLEVPAGATVSAPATFVEAIPLAAISVRASEGVVVPAAVGAARSGPGYAVVTGVPFPLRLPEVP